MRWREWSQTGPSLLSGTRPTQSHIIKILTNVHSSCFSLSFHVVDILEVESGTWGRCKMFTISNSPFFVCVLQTGLEMWSSTALAKLSRLLGTVVHFQEVNYYVI